MTGVVSEGRGFVSALSYVVSEDLREEGLLVCCCMLCLSKGELFGGVG